MDVNELHDEENLLAQMQDRRERSAFLRPFGSKTRGRAAASLCEELRQSGWDCRYTRPV